MASAAAEINTIDVDFIVIASTHLASNMIRKNRQMVGISRIKGLENPLAAGIVKAYRACNRGVCHEI